MYSRLLSHRPVLSVWFSLLAFPFSSMVLVFVVLALILTSTALLASSRILLFFLGLRFPLS